MMAAGTNKSGRERTPGDKKRAILMARKTTSGATMGIRELARHVGVSAAWVHDVVECSVPNATYSTASEPSRSRNAVKRDAARAAMLKDPAAPATAVAGIAGCSVDLVYDERKKLNLPPIDKGAGVRRRHEGV